jgi:hypothetical protein
MPTQLLDSLLSLLAQLPSFLLSLTSGILIAIVTALLTVKLAQRQFATQQWWEKKAQIYSEIIEQLTLLLIANEDMEMAQMADLNDDTGSASGEPRLRERYRVAGESLGGFRKLAAMGSFVVSETTIGALQELRSAFTPYLSELELNLSDSSWGVRYYGDCVSAIQRCLATIRQEAKADLMLTRRR